MTMRQKLNAVGYKLKKNSPAIFTGVGIVGLGWTAWEAYKSRDKVEAVVEGIERKRDLEQPIDKLEVAKGLTEALYKPVVVGTLSVTSILLAQKIQNNRIKVLVGTLAVEQARNLYFEKKYKDKHGEDEYRKFMAPTEDVETIEVDKKGKEKVTITQVKKELDQTLGQWYDDSQHFVSDDMEYNRSMIDSVNEQMQTILFQRGHLILNEVREALGLERIRNGALLGWSSADSFEINKEVYVLGDDEMGSLRDNIYVSWSRPRYIYDEVSFTGRYSPFEF